MPLAGVFGNGTRLSNGGETIRLESPGGLLIQEVSYRDDPPWPSESDGSGPSLVLQNAQTNPDPDLSTNWRTSSLNGGSPGSEDPGGFDGDPSADLDRDGFTAFAEYAMGTNDRVPGDATGLVSFVINAAGHWELTFPVSVKVPDVTTVIEQSPDLENWTNASDTSTLSATHTLGSRQFQTHTSISQARQNRRMLRVRFQQKRD